MPDQYGRTTGEDWLKLAKGIGDWGRASREEDDKNQVGLGLGELEKNPTAERPPNVDPRNWTKAQEQHGKSQSAALLAEQARLGREEYQYAENIFSEMGKAKTQEERQAYLAGLAPSTLGQARGLAQVRRLLAENEDAARSMLELQMKTGMVEYEKVVRPALKGARGVFGQGNEADAATALSALYDGLSFPGRYQYDPENKTLDYYHNERSASILGRTDAALNPVERDPDMEIDTSSASATPGLGLGDGAQARAPGAGGQTQDKKAAWGQTPRAGMLPPARNDGYSYVRSYSVKEALDIADALTAKLYANQRAASRNVFSEFNAKSFTDDVHVARDKDGARKNIVPQRNMDTGAMEFLVFNGDTGAFETRLGNDAFIDSGLRVITKQQQQIDTEARKASVEERRLGLQERSMGLRESGGGRGKSLLDEALAVGQKAANQAAKDGLTTPEEARDAGEAAAFEHVEKKTGRKVGSWDEVRALSGGQAKPAQGQQPQPQAPARGLGLGGGGAPAAPRTSAQALFDQMHGKK